MHSSLVDNSRTVGTTEMSTLRRTDKCSAVYSHPGEPYSSTQTLPLPPATRTELRDATPSTGRQSWEHRTTLKAGSWRAGKSSPRWQSPQGSPVRTGQGRAQRSLRRFLGWGDAPYLDFGSGMQCKDESVPATSVLRVCKLNLNLKSQQNISQTVQLCHMVSVTHLSYWRAVPFTFSTMYLFYQYWPL